MRDTQREDEWDRLLKIHTMGRDDSIAGEYNYPYEPTNYPVLERLANEGFIRKDNCLLDYGCGKGRVSFYMSYQTRCSSIGVDYDARMIHGALENQKKAVSGGRTEFFCENAGKYVVPKEVDRVYFFNPFSTRVLESVLARIRESYSENPREIKLFFYYPSDEYVGRLMQEDALEFVDEIDCRDLFEGEDPRERILVFAMQ